MPRWYSCMPFWLKAGPCTTPTFPGSSWGCSATRSGDPGHKKPAVSHVWALCFPLALGFLHFWYISVGSCQHWLRLRLPVALQTQSNQGYIPGRLFAGRIAGVVFGHMAIPVTVLKPPRFAILSKPSLVATTVMLAALAFVLGCVWGFIRRCR